MSAWSDFKDITSDFVEEYFFPTDRFGDPVYVMTGFAILMIPIVLPVMLTVALLWLLGRALHAAVGE